MRVVGFVTEVKQKVPSLSATTRMKRPKDRAVGGKRLVSLVEETAKECLVDRKDGQKGEG